MDHVRELVFKRAAGGALYAVVGPYYQFLLSAAFQIFEVFLAFLLFVERTPAAFFRVFRRDYRERLRHLSVRAAPPALVEYLARRVRVERGRYFGYFRHVFVDEARETLRVSKRARDTERAALHEITLHVYAEERRPDFVLRGARQFFGAGFCEQRAELERVRLFAYMFHAYDFFKGCLHFIQHLRLSFFVARPPRIDKRQERRAVLSFLFFRDAFTLSLFLLSPCPLCCRRARP